MYVHVPCAWLSLFYYLLIAIFSIAFYITLNPLFDIAAISIASMGALLCLNTLVTGSIWGKPTWGTWWVWDARLTSTAILFLIYLSYIMLRSSFYDEERSAKVSAIFAVIGAINIPIIKFSVNLWSTLHQGSSQVWKGASSPMHESMRYPLLVTALGIALFTGAIIMCAMQSEIIRRKIARYEGEVKL